MFQLAKNGAFVGPLRFVFLFMWAANQLGQFRTTIIEDTPLFHSKQRQTTLYFFCYYKHTRKILPSFCSFSAYIIIPCCVPVLIRVVFYLLLSSICCCLLFIVVFYLLLSTICCCLLYIIVLVCISPLFLLLVEEALPSGTGELDLAHYHNSITLGLRANAHRVSVGADSVDSSYVVCGSAGTDAD